MWAGGGGGGGGARAGAIVGIDRVGVGSIEGRVIPCATLCMCEIEREDVIVRVCMSFRACVFTF